MGRTPKPWWREDRKAYYATVNGVRYRLGTSLKQANAELQRLLRQQAIAKPARESIYFCSVMDDCLGWVQQNRSEKTYQHYAHFLHSFYSRWPNILTDELMPSHVTTWLAEKKWNATTQRRAIAAISRAVNWGIRNLGLTKNTLAQMEKPKAVRRTTTITIQEMRAILRITKDKAFRKLLIFCWDAGCRPQEAKQLEPRHVDLERRRCIIPPEEAKGKRQPRIVYVPTQRAWRIVLAGMQQQRILLNTRGKPWTKSAVKCRFDRIEKKLHKRFRQYDIRHTWITRKLVANVDSHIVAQLAGHSNTRMLDEVYSHVSADYKFMLEQAGRERAPLSRDKSKIASTD